MSLNSDSPADSNAPLPQQTPSSQRVNLNDKLVRLRGFRIDDIGGPRISPYQVASYKNGAYPTIEEENDLSAEIVITSTKREANYAHRGWSNDASTATCPWTCSRFAARNQPNSEGTWYTKLTKTRRLKVEVFLKDLAPTPRFEAEIKDALDQSTLFEKFQAIYRVLEHWGDVVPLEIEVGSSMALTGDRLSYVQPSELDEISPRNISARLSNFKNVAATITGANFGWTYDQWTADQRYSTGPAKTDQWERITVNRVAPTITLLCNDLQGRLSELYAQRLSYVPLKEVGAIGWNCRTYDDNKHASRTISNIKIRSSDFIELLSITYSDSVTSNSHGGGGHVGTEYEFALGVGEHIAEMFIWVEGDWMHGLQFITTTGRFSPQYGVHFGAPTIARCQGCVLAGFLSQTKLHPQYGELFSGIQGIWRRDLIPRVPKEEDVYSEYFGDKNRSGRPFNDRIFVGSSKSIFISSIEVGWGDVIDSIRVIFTNKEDGRELRLPAMRHGGPGGHLYQFILEDGEHIVSVSGKHEVNCMTQLCFGTNRGRTSQVLGGGKGQPFSLSAPRDRDENHFRLQYICGK
ncbi:jacalin-like lectin domain protein, partial [Rhizoctonia solani 123E]